MSDSLFEAEEFGLDVLYVHLITDARMRGEGITVKDFEEAARRLDLIPEYWPERTVKTKLTVVKSECDEALAKQGDTVVRRRYGVYAITDDAHEAAHHYRRKIRKDIREVRRLRSGINGGYKRFGGDSEIAKNKRNSADAQLAALEFTLRDLMALSFEEAPASRVSKARGRRAAANQESML